MLFNDKGQNPIKGDKMHILSAKLTFIIPHATSLKDKRQVSRSLIDKTRRKFNVSVAETGAQDVHKTLIVGLALVSGSPGHARESLEEVIRFMEANTDGELVEITEE